MTAATLTIDPGSRRTGLGIIMAIGGPPMAWCLDSPTIHDIDGTLAWAHDQFAGDIDVVIEGQHVQIIGGKGSAGPKVNWKSLQALVRNAEWWHAIAAVRGMTVHRPIAARWQGPIFATVPAVSEQGKKLSTKQRSRLWARRQWSRYLAPAQPVPTAEGFSMLPTAKPTDKLPTDPCDALAMGYWFRTNV